VTFAPVAVNSLLYGGYVAGWAFFALGPQLVICLLFAWSACRRTHADMLSALTKGFLWSLLPFVGVAVMWWIWRKASRKAGGGGENARPGGGPREAARS
jgi:hypothetical protein